MSRRDQQSPTTINKDELFALLKRADQPSKMLRKTDVAEMLGVSVWTLERWLRLGRFPKPIFLTDSSPMQWRLRDVEAFIEVRRRKRRHAPPLRGAFAPRRRRGGRDAR